MSDSVSFRFSRSRRCCTTWSKRNRCWSAPQYLRCSSTPTASPTWTCSKETQPCRPPFLHPCLHPCLPLCLHPGVCISPGTSCTLAFKKSFRFVRPNCSKGLPHVFICVSGSVPREFSGTFKTSSRRFLCLVQTSGESEICQMEASNVEGRGAGLI